MSSELAIINSNLEKVEKRFIALTNAKTWEREKAYALQHFRKNTYLQKASVHSTLEAIINVANTGLSLNPALKLAYLVPRYTSGQVEVVLEPSYQGLVKLITDTGSAKNVYAHVVFDGDIFEETLGTSVEIKHVPKRQSNTVILVYAVAVLHDGTMQIEVMTAEEVNEIRDKSESYKSFKAGKAKSAIWNDHYNEMARKTVIKRLCKYLPKTDQWDKLGNAIQLADSDYQVSDGQITYIESLLRHANISQEHNDKIYQEMHSYTSTEAAECITYLGNNQVDPISSGHNYSQTDIKNKQKNEIS